MSKEYVIPGVSNVSRDGFTITRVWSGVMPNMKERIQNTKITVHVSNSDYHKTYESENGFTVRKIFELQNDTYLAFADECYGGNCFDNMDIHGFKLEGDNIYTIYST